MSPWLRQPEGAVAPFDREALLRAAQGLVARAQRRAGTMPDTLRAMQEATLAVYDEFDDDN